MGGTLLFTQHIKVKAFNLFACPRGLTQKLQARCHAGVQHKAAYLDALAQFFPAVLVHQQVEGALHRVMANSRFTGHPITLEFAKEALRDLLALQEKLISIDNIQKKVAEYFQIRVGDLLSKSRSRSVTRPRQIAMSLTKELTSHSLPEIGDAFGGRDHTTVLHSCKKIELELTTNSELRRTIEQLTTSLLA